MSDSIPTESQDVQGKLFCGVIPSAVLYDHDLTVNEKLLLGILGGFDYYNKDIFVGNKALALPLNVHEKSIPRMLKKLQDKGFIKVLIDKNAGNIRTIKVLQSLNSFPNKNTPPSNTSVTTPSKPTRYEVVTPALLPSNTHVTISNNINKNISTLSKEEEDKNTALMRYFIEGSKTLTGHFQLKKYLNIYLLPKELKYLVDLYKKHKISWEEQELIWLKCDNQMKLSNKDTKVKSGMAFNYLTTHLLEDSLRLKKFSNNAQMINSPPRRS